jgi:hypothetical protein
MAWHSEHEPNDESPATDVYELLNVFGEPTDVTALARQGEPLRAAPARPGVAQEGRS